VVYRKNNYLEITSNSSTKVNDDEKQIINVKFSDKKSRTLALYNKTVQKNQVISTARSTGNLYCIPLKDQLSFAKMLPYLGREKQRSLADLSCITLIETDRFEKALHTFNVVSVNVFKCKNLVSQF
jgi:hypothetical protein